VISGVANPGGVAGNTTITATILNSDGRTMVEVTDTLTVVDAGPGIAEWNETLFGAGTPATLPVPRPAKADAAPVHNPSS
jgi:hypothetical protein